MNHFFLKNCRFFSVLVLGLISQWACAQMPLYKNDAVSIRYSKIISPEALKKKLMVLTADSLEGRETGTIGAQKAASYIASIFRRDKLEAPVSTADHSKSYFLPVPLKLWVPQDGKLTLSDNVLESGKDFIPISRAANLKLTLNQSDFLIGVHYSSDSSYENLFGTENIENRIVFLFDQNPTPTSTSIQSRVDLYRYLSAISITLRDLINKKKPRAVFLVSNEVASLSGNANYKNYRSTPQMGFDPSGNGNSRGIFLISPEAFDKVLNLGGINQDKLLKSPTGKPFLISQKIQLELPVKLDETKDADVLGFMEGTDLKNEVLIVSAHYDHLGTHDGKIYHGADDDGSGSAAILTIADAFSKAKKEGHGPRRSILFLANVGEEKGLLGSYYYSEHPVFPISHTISDLNVDMIGRIDNDHLKDSNYVYVIGSGKLSSGLQSISEEVNQKFSHLTLDYRYDSPKDPNRFYYRSDHYNFARLGIPIIFYFNGVHEDYHQPTDVIEKINFGIYSKRAQLVFFTAWDLANREDRPLVDRKSDFTN